MTAQVIQLRDYQNPKDIERMQRELEKEAAAILVPFVETTGFTEMNPGDGYIKNLEVTRRLAEEFVGPHSRRVDGMELGKDPA